MLLNCGRPVKGLGNNDGEFYRELDHVARLDEKDKRL